MSDDTISQTSATLPEVNAAIPDERGGFLSRFTVLLHAPRELWLALIIKFLMFAAYGLTNSTLKLWLSSDFGYSDTQALALVGAWSLVITIVTLLVGSLTDAIGLRKTFFLGVWICAVARLTMAFATVKWLAIAGGLFPLAIGEALGAPSSRCRHSPILQYKTTLNILLIPLHDDESRLPGRRLVV